MIGRPSANLGGYVIALGLAASAAACAGSAAGVVPVVSCPVGDTAMVRDVVYFGRNRPGGGTVSDPEWTRFLDQVVTPHFPDGFTVVEATGRWKGQSGAIEQEQSEVVTLLHSNDERARRAVAAIAAEYKARFRQEAVLRERTVTCARFE